MNMITGKMSQGSTSSANHTSSMNIAGDKMFSHLGRVAGDRRPITADIFLTNYCNNRCPYCTYGRWELDEGAYAMSLDDFIIYANRLRELGVHKMRLMTNNPVKRVGLEAYGLEIVENVPIEITPNPYNERYLRTKKERMGHTLHFNK